MNDDTPGTPRSDRASAERRADRLGSVAIAGAALLFYACGIRGGSLLNSDDAIYAQMAREMVAGGDFIDNHWLGVVHFEKPPLLIWSLALAGRWLGWSEGALRLPVTLFAVGALIAFFCLARALRMGVAASLTGVGLLAGSTLFLLMTRRLMTDVPLLCCALAAAACVLRGRHVACGAFAGLALLAKGPAAVPMLAALAAYGIHAGVSWRGLARAAGIALLVAAPWHLAVSLRHGSDFWAGYLGHHVASRMTSAVVPGMDSTRIFQLLALERVLLPLAAIGLVLAARRRLSNASDRFVVVWLVCTMAPLIVSTTVLPHYLLPVVPAFALLAAGALPERLWQQSLAPALATGVVVVAFLAEPEKVVWWLDPDFGPDEKAIGLEIKRSARPDDLVIAFNLTRESLVFYSGGHAIPIYADDRRFLAVQHAVLMNQRQRDVYDLGQHPVPHRPGAHLFVVARAEPDRPRATRWLRDLDPKRPVFEHTVGQLVLISDAASVAHPNPP